MLLLADTLFFVKHTTQGLMLPKYLGRSFNTSIQMAAWSNVALIDWIYAELLTQLKTMSATQQNRAGNADEGERGSLVPQEHVFAGS